MAEIRGSTYKISATWKNYYLICMLGDNNNINLNKTKAVCSAALTQRTVERLKL